MTLKENLLIKLTDISNCLKENNEINGTQGVLAGEPGIALFLFYYSKFIQDDTFSDLGLKILEKSVEIINSGYNLTSFCSGISGTAWVFNHLEMYKFLDINNDIFLNELEDQLYKKMIKDIIDNNYDFLHNSLGIALYFLKRHQNTKSNILKENYTRYINNFVFELNKISLTEDNSIYWITKFDNKDEKKVINLSLSHGISSILNFLTRLYELEIFRESLKEIIPKIINSILLYLNTNSNGFFFPNNIKENTELNYITRLAWCNGDLGICLSLWKASKAINDKELENFSKNLLIQTCKRTNYKSTLVNDAGLCHGSFGIAQIYIYLYRKTNIIDFKNSAEFWLKDGLFRLNHEDSNAGHKKLTINGWENELSLLEGISGIGLSIMAYLDEEFSLWDECLMIN